MTGPAAAPSSAPAPGSDLFSVEIADGLATLRLSRAPANLFRFEDWRRLAALVAALEADASLRAVLLTGQPGRHFSGGNDHREFVPRPAAELRPDIACVRDALRTVAESRLCFVAALHGAAYGSAFMLAACCDLRLATPDARLGMPEVKAGAVGGYSIVRACLPPGEARRLCFTGEPMSGERAWSLGFVQELASPEALEDRGATLARALLREVRPERRGAVRAFDARIDWRRTWEDYEAEIDLIVDYLAGAGAGDGDDADGNPLSGRSRAR